MTGYPQSAREAHQRLRDLDRALSDPARREAARVELRELAELARGKPEGAPLRLATVDAAVGSHSAHLDILLLPSIFAPEDWAFTFLEGLLEVPLEEYQGRSLVEVGTGSGWVALALAKFTGLARIHGVDLNPQSPVVARCNLWLNGGEELAARVSFAESDLLLGLPAEMRLDFVVGCIPQVLREGAAAEGEQALHDLSNYAAMQNVYEDHFGLGLIARLLDEVPERLAPGGRVLLNLAGRPGRDIIERMFSRRGFSTRVLVAGRVTQAADTDIRPLVELEARTGRAFEFYMLRHSPEPIVAATALGWLEAGNPVWHEVAVWEASLRLPRETLALRAALRSMGSEGLLADLDLATASQEQLDFVSSLAERMAGERRLPYADEAGDPGFRRLVTRYLDRYFGLVLGEEEIFVGPEREQALFALLLATCEPGDQVLVSRDLHAVYARALARAGVEVVVTNNTLREVRRLVGAFSPRVVLLSVESSERSNLGALRQILDEAAERGTLVVLDESAFFNITRAVEPRTLFEFLAREPHRGNLVVLYGLIKHAVYPDLELTLLLPVPPGLAADLARAAEVTYSRVGTLAEWLHARTFEGLLSFRIRFSGEAAPPARAPAALPRSRRAVALAEEPAFAPRIFDPADPGLIRLDHGENELPVPGVLAEGMVLAAAEPARSPPPALEQAVASFLLETRGTRYAPEEIAVGQGVWPLLSDLGVALRQRLGRAPRVFVAAPAYGVLPASLRAAGCEVTWAPLPPTGAPDAVVISQPQNPLGAYLSRAELTALASFAVERGCLLVSDEIFGLVNLTHLAAETVMSPLSLEQQVPGIGRRTVVLGGLSKELAAGGLRVGFLASHDPELVAALRAVSLAPLPLLAGRAAAHVYAAYLRTAAGRLVHPERHRRLQAELTSMRRELAERRSLLASALPPEDVGAAERGGLFLAPRMTPWLGRKMAGEVIDARNLPAILYRHTHLVVNSGAYVGDEARIRAVFSLPEEKVERAAATLRAFAAALE